MKLSRLVSWLLIAFTAWSWVIWPTFLKNISGDPRSWDEHGSATPFFTVHLVLTVVSLACGSLIGVLGVRGLLALRRATEPQMPSGPETAPPLSDLPSSSISSEKDHIGRG